MTRHICGAYAPQWLDVIVDADPAARSLESHDLMPCPTSPPLAASSARELLRIQVQDPDYVRLDPDPVPPPSRPFNEHSALGELPQCSGSNGTSYMELFLEEARVYDWVRDQMRQDSACCRVRTQTPEPTFKFAYDAGQVVHELRSRSCRE